MIWILTAVTVVFSAHAVMFAAATAWYAKQTGLWRTDYYAAQSRAQNKPWWVRYFERTVGR